ncbi:MAG TPA: NAD-dependent epimerase/dehydratase family protein [Planctomycetota bacterium]|nr:NAD-dependent epimerase/dehydratase family protein [Planctomycetota bacterium]
MTPEAVVLVTGAGGEMGHGLIEALAGRGVRVVAFDLKEPDAAVRAKCRETVGGDIVRDADLAPLFERHRFEAVFHLAALLSTSGERAPEKAHAVNVQGTLNLLNLCAASAQRSGEPVKFLFPSTIAVYGLPDLETKARFARIKEHQYIQPTTMYGCNKLYCENLGRYFAKHYRRLSADADRPSVDFRAIRFPGLISAFTVPSGGTSDYAPEMLHAAAQGRPYACFVAEDRRIPFMAMPDGVDALLRLADAKAERLTSHVYNIGAFAPSAAEIADRVRAAFPKADVTFAPDLKRQAIVDTWPADVDDALARYDFGFTPRYDFERCFDEYLVPNIRRRYGAA